MNYTTDDLGLPRFRAHKNLNYSYPLNLSYSNALNNNMANFGDARRLPYKIRAVFIPSCSLPLQQPYTGPLVRNSLD